MQEQCKVFWWLPSFMVKIKDFIVCSASSFWNKIESWAAITTIIGLGIGLHQYYQNSEDKKKNVTIQYLTSFSDMLTNTDPVLLDTINFFNNKSCDSIIYNEYGEINKDTLEKLLQENKTWRLQLDNILVYLNNLAIGCQKEFYDERTAWYSNHYRIINAVNALYPYIDIRAKEEDYDAYSKPCGYLRAMQYRWLHKIGECEKWEKEESIKSKRVREKIQRWNEKNRKD